MNEASFAALDLAGAIHHLALCEAAPAAGPDNPAWLIRSRIRQMYSWLRDQETRDTADPIVPPVAEVLNQWGVQPGPMPLVCLTRAAGPAIFAIAGRLGWPTVILPRGNHVISPRGIALASSVKDYAHALQPPAWPGIAALRDAFVPLMERAADDVQADGLEQDDSFLDRFAEIRVPGAARTLLAPVETTTDPQWLAAAWSDVSTRLGGPPVDLQTVSISMLRLRCIVEPAAAAISTLPLTDGQLARARLPGAPIPAYPRDKLLAGDAGSGPTRIDDAAVSIEIPPAWAWELNAAGHLICRSVSS